MDDIDQRALVERNRREAEKANPNTESVQFFFACFKTSYPTSLQQVAPTPGAFAALRRRYAPILNTLSKDQIDKGFAKSSEMRMNGEKRLDFPDIEKIIGVITGKFATQGCTPPAGIYKDKCKTIGKNVKSGKDIAETTFRKLKGMLN